MSRLQDVILQDTRANQPLATAVSVGTLFGVTDEGDIIERSDGAAWVNYSPSASQTGTIVQVVNVETGAVNTGTTVMPVDDTVPQKTEGDEYMTLAITPTSATNKLKIDVFAVLSTSRVGGTTFITALFQDTANDALAAVAFQTKAAGDMDIASFSHYMTAGTTSATTFKVRAGGAGAGTVTFNGSGGSRLLGGVMASGITIMEIVP